MFVVFTYVFTDTSKRLSYLIYKSNTPINECEFPVIAHTYKRENFLFGAFSLYKKTLSCLQSEYMMYCAIQSFRILKHNCYQCAYSNAILLLYTCVFNAHMNIHNLKVWSEHIMLPALAVVVCSWTFIYLVDTHFMLIFNAGAI